MVPRRAFLVALLSGAAGCTTSPSDGQEASPPASSSTETTRTATRTTATDATETTDETPAENRCADRVDPRLQWSLDTGRRVFRPAVHDGVVYAGGYDQTLYAVAADTGTVLWESAANVDFDVSPSVSEDTVTVGGYSRVAGFDASTGERRWSFSPPGDRASLAPTHGNGGDVVYVGASQRPTPETDPEPTYDRVYALDRSDGSVAWEASTVPDGRDMWAVPEAVTAASGSVYVGTEQGELVVLDAADGAVRWRRHLAETRASARRPVVRDGTVYQTVGDTVYALAAASGATRWRAVGESRPAVSDGVGYWVFGSTLVAVSLDDGTERWTARVDREGCLRPPVVGGGVVYVTLGCRESNATLLVFDAADGCRLGSVELASADATAPLVTGGSVYVGGMGDGGGLWSFSAAVPVDSS